MKYKKALGAPGREIRWQLSFLRPLVFLALLVLLVFPIAPSAQTTKSFTFHTDAEEGDGAEQDITGLTVIGVTLIGSITSNRAATFEVADSIGTYTPVKCFDIDTQASSSTSTLNGTVPHRFQCPVAGFKKFRVRISGGTTGTLTAVGLGLASARGNPGMGGGGGGPGGGGNVSNSGTPTPGQIAQWVDDIHIGGITLVPVPSGGSGVGTLASKGVLIGQGTQPFQSMVPTGNSQCFMSDPTNYATVNPSFQSCPTSPGGGSNVRLDLGNDASLESTALTDIATVGDTNAIFTEPSANKFLIDVTKKWPIAGTADALSANGANCVTTGQFAAGVSSTGVAEGCAFPSWADLLAGTILSKAFLVGAASTFGPTGGGLVTANGLTGPISLSGGTSIVPGSGDVTANHLTGTLTVTTGSSLRPTAAGAIEANEVTGLVIADVLTKTNTNRVTNKQIVPKKVTQTISANAFTVNIDTTDVAEVPALSAGVTVNISAGTNGNPADYQDIDIVFAPTTTPQSITWSTSFSERANMLLPTSTTGDNSKFDLVKVRWFPTITKWVIIAKTMGVEPGITTLASSTTYTCPHLVSSACEMEMSGAPGTLTVAEPSGGTPANGKQLDLRFMCSPNAQDFVWNGIFVGSFAVGLPQACPVPVGIAQWLQVRAVYSTVLTKWQIVQVNMVDPMVTTLTSSTTYTCPASVSKACEMQMTGGAGTVTMNAPTGTPINGQMLLLRMMCTNTQSLSWNAAYVASPNVPLPTQCIAGTTQWYMYGVIWSSVLSKWQLYASN